VQNNLKGISLQCRIKNGIQMKENKIINNDLQNDLQYLVQIKQNMDNVSWKHSGSQFFNSYYEEVVLRINELITALNYCTTKQNDI